KNGQSKSNQQVLNEAITEIRPQFDWLDLGFVIYDDIVGDSKHQAHGQYGHHVEVFQKYGKNALIFYRVVNDKVNEEFADAISSFILSKHQDITRLLTVKRCYEIVARAPSKLMKYHCRSECGYLVRMLVSRPGVPRSNPIAAPKSQVD
ncbi:MAG: hypothetical protein GY694_16050, partial [Gammaproteobacteria bacterium]|nr:hypothetical protein [Gammaproteobacteria bacterium]